LTATQANKPPKPAKKEPGLIVELVD